MCAKGGEKKHFSESEKRNDLRALGFFEDEIDYLLKVIEGMPFRKLEDLAYAVRIWSKGKKA